MCVCTGSFFGSFFEQSKQSTESTYFIVASSYYTFVLSLDCKIITKMSIFFMLTLLFMFMFVVRASFNPKMALSPSDPSSFSRPGKH